MVCGSSNKLLLSKHILCKIQFYYHLSVPMNGNMSSLRWAIFMILVSSAQILGKSVQNAYNPIETVALLDPAKVVCTIETMKLCQKCAKQTKSAVVYPWCCANHEGVREWCEHYLHFGLP